MSLTQTDSKPEGRIPTLIGLIKRLVFEDPIIGILCLVILFPVGYAITSNAITGQIEDLPVLLGVEAAVVVLCLPLIITKTWKNNQRALMEQKRIAIEAEALKRVTREKHKQGRLDEVMDAKIKLLQAQTTLILDQSDRHEQQLLVASAKELKQKFGTVKEICDIKTHINVINAELTKVETDYDKVLGAIDRIEAKLGTKTEPPAEIAVKDVVEDVTDYKTLFEQKQSELEQISKKTSEILAEGGRLQTELTKVATHNTELKADLARERRIRATTEKNYQELVAEQLRAPPPETLKEIPENQELLIQTEKIQAKLAPATEEPMPSEDDIKEAIQVVDELEDESPEGYPTISMRKGRPEEPAPNFWNCPNCGRANNLKQNRCPACGCSKPVMTTNA